MNTDFSSLDYFLDLLSIVIFMVAVVAIPGPATVKRWLLTLTGAYLLFFIAPRLVVFYIGGWACVYLLQQLVARTGEDRRGIYALWSSILILLAPMVTWKLTYQQFNIDFNVVGNQLVSLFGAGVWELDLARQIIIPIGLSFATFRAIDLIIKSYLGQIGPLSFDRVMFFGFFPPVQVIGPVIQYTEISSQADQFKITDQRR